MTDQTPKEPLSRGKSALRILAPLILAGGLILAMKLGVFGEAKATLRYDIGPFLPAQTASITLLNAEGIEASTLWTQIKSGERTLEQTRKLVTGVYTANAVFTGSKGEETRGTAEIDVKQSGTYEVRLKPVEAP